jgi:hypothetical protein
MRSGAFGLRFLAKSAARAGSAWRSRAGRAGFGPVARCWMAGDASLDGIRGLNPSGDCPVPLASFDGAGPVDARMSDLGGCVRRWWRPAGCPRQGGGGATRNGHILRRPPRAGFVIGGASRMPMGGTETVSGISESGTAPALMMLTLGAAAGTRKGFLLMELEDRTLVQGFHGFGGETWLRRTGGDAVLPTARLAGLVTSAGPCCTCSGTRPLFEGAASGRRNLPSDRGLAV